MNWNTFTFDLEGTGNRVTGAEIDGENWFLFSDLLKAFDLEDLSERTIERLVDKGWLVPYVMISEDDERSIKFCVHEDGGLYLALLSDTLPARLIQERYFEAIRKARQTLDLDVPEFLQAGFNGVSAQELINQAKERRGE